MRRAVGIDVGGTHLRAAVVDAGGAVLRRERCRLERRDPDSLLEAVASLCRQLGSDAGALPVGVGLAAQLWVRTGTIAVAPNLGWREVAFGSMLERRFGRPVRLVNDLNAIAYGETVAGAGGGSRDVACVFVGTGVGMGAVVQGGLVEGHDGLATEIGHVKIEDVVSGRLCGCGERGCLEAYTGGRHLPELYAQAGGAGAGDASSIEAAAARGEVPASALWKTVADRLGRAIGNAVTLFNPEVLILGGGVLASAPSLRAATGARITAYAARAAQRNLQVRDAALGDDAGIVGAALLALR